MSHEADGASPGDERSVVARSIPADATPVELLFRAQALQQLDVPAAIDNRLPLVRRRTWLLLVGAAALVLAAALWAFLTPSITSVRGDARVVAYPGVLPISSSAGGTLLSVAAPGAVVGAGAPIARIATGAGGVDVVSEVAGTVWQTPGIPGARVEAGAAIVTLLPPGSTRTVLLALTQADGASVRQGMGVSVTAGQFASGSVVSVSPPMSGVDAGRRVAQVLDAGDLYVLVTVSLDSDLPAGQSASGQVIVSDSTVLSRLVPGS